MGNLTSIVLTVLAPDRPGLVERISAVIVRHGGNWLQSHLSRMAGYFGGLIHVTVPDQNADALVRALEGLGDQGVVAVVRKTSGPVESEEAGDVGLSLMGNDRPGIVNRITEAIARKGVNVVSLETEYGSAPMAGNEMFSVRARLRMPPAVSLADLKRDLEMIAGDLMVDVSLE
jgi:glycine cleavage system regulatory protein